MISIVNDYLVIENEQKDRVLSDNKEDLLTCIQKLPDNLQENQGDKNEANNNFDLLIIIDDD